METQDSLNGTNTPMTPQQIADEYKKSLLTLKPITDNAEVMAVVKSYLKDSSHQVNKEASEAIGVFLKVFTHMQQAIDGETLSVSDMQTMFMGETLMLDLNNSWYRTMKPILEPVIAESKVSLTTALQLRNRPEDLRHETDNDTIWSLVISSWDFIPWFIFTATGNLNSYISSKELFRRMIIMAKPELIKG